MTGTGSRLRVTSFGPTRHKVLIAEGDPILGVRNFLEKDVEFKEKLCRQRYFVC